MPLPPLPDNATLNGPGHLTDSQQIETFLKALAEQYKITLDPIPPIAPGQPGHVAWHNAIVSGAKKISDSIKVPVDLPAVVTEGSLNHVKDHNQIKDALDKLSKVIPFSIVGGSVYKVNGWTFNIFDQPGTDTFTVFGSGTAHFLAVGGGGAAGFTDTKANPGGRGGHGGGGGVKTMYNYQIKGGIYEVSVGYGGKFAKDVTKPGATGEASRVSGQGGLDFSAGGGGGGGSADSYTLRAVDAGNGFNGGSGGGGAVAYELNPDFQSYKTWNTSRAGYGVDGGNDGNVPRYEFTTGGGYVFEGAGGGAGSPPKYQTIENQGENGGEPWKGTNLEPWKTYYDELGSNLGAGAPPTDNQPGTGGQEGARQTVDLDGNPGLIVVAWKAEA